MAELRRWPDRAWRHWSWRSLHLLLRYCCFGPGVVVGVFVGCMLLAIYAGGKMMLPIYTHLRTQQRLHVLDDLDEVSDK